MGASDDMAWIWGEDAGLVTDEEIFAMLDEEVARELIPRQAGGAGEDITD
jgi:hypothetical protein